MAKLVVIEKMSMPKKCINCRFASKNGDIYKCQATKRINPVITQPFETRADFCPLVEVDMNAAGPNNRPNETIMHESADYVKGYSDGWYKQREIILEQLYHHKSSSLIDKPCESFDHYKCTFNG